MELKELDQKPEVIEFLLWFVKTLQGFLLLSGKNGTGKSHCARAVHDIIAPYWFEGYEDSAIFITQADLNARWIQDNSKFGETFSLLKQLCSAKLLIIDDVGTREPTASFMDFLYSLSDKRYNERTKKATIITTNLTSSEMRQMFGDAFVSRVASGKCFRFEGEDRRFKQDVF